MRITAGDTLKKYATIKNIPIKEVVEWVNDYVNRPGQDSEWTTERRLKEIQLFILTEIEESTQGHIEK